MPAWYTFKNPTNLPYLVIILIVGIFVLGYTIFYQSNLQKYQFRSDPSKPIWGKTPKSVRTANGRNLLISGNFLGKFVENRLTYLGWWGVTRKPNYTGDLIMAYS